MHNLDLKGGKKESLGLRLMHAVLHLGAPRPQFVSKYLEKLIELLPS